MGSPEQRSGINIKDRRNGVDQGRPGLNIEVGSPNTIVINGERRITVGEQCVLNSEVVTLKEVQIGKAKFVDGKGNEITVLSNAYNTLSIAGSIATV